MSIVFAGRLCLKGFYDMVYDKGKVGCLAKRLGLPVDIFNGYRSLMNDIRLETECRVEGLFFKGGC